MLFHITFNERIKTNKRKRKECDTYNLLGACSKLDERTRLWNHLVHESAVRYFTINATIIISPSGTIKNITVEIHQREHLILQSCIYNLRHRNESKRDTSFYSRTYLEKRKIAPANRHSTKISLKNYQLLILIVKCDVESVNFFQNVCLVVHPFECHASKWHISAVFVLSGLANEPGGESFGHEEAKKARSGRDYPISRYSRLTAIVRCSAFVPLRFAG